MKDSLLLIGFFGLLLSPFLPAIVLRARVLGLTRMRGGIAPIHGEDIHIISDTAACEDLHLHHPSQLLFAACQDNTTARSLWFPPLEQWSTPEAANQGSIRVVDPKTFTSKRLILNGFNGPFITHGIDIFSTQEDPDLVYIFAVNHVPNPGHFNAPHKSSNKTRSQIEIFSHKIGTSTAEFLRSVYDPQIHTPNDIYATSPTSFYVTNDHYYRAGWLRGIEEILTAYLAGWSSTNHVEITDMKAAQSHEGLHVTTALTGLHNNNGLGRASVHRPEEVIIVDAAGGLVTRAKRSLEPSAPPKLEVIEHIQLLSCLDNPFYYDDPYATPTNNASGYILPGLARGMALAADFPKLRNALPVMVWHVRSTGEFLNKQAAWDRNVIFQDETNLLRSASGSVMLPIDPIETGGKKQAWLFVTGFASEAMIATRVDL